MRASFCGEVKMRVAAYGLPLLLLLPATGCAERVVAALPQRDAGFWEVTQSTTEGARRTRSTVSLQCTHADVDAPLLLSIAPGQEHCAEPEVRRTGSEWEVRTSCRVHDNPIETRFTLQGDFSNSYSGSYETRYDKACPAGAPDCREVRTFTARRLGDCPEDMHPGDMMLPNGIVVNPLKSHNHDHRSEAQ